MQAMSQAAIMSPSRLSPSLTNSMPLAKPMASTPSSSSELIPHSPGPSICCSRIEVWHVLAGLFFSLGFTFGVEGISGFRTLCDLWLWVRTDDLFPCHSRISRGGSCSPDALAARGESIKPIWHQNVNRLADRPCATPNLLGSFNNSHSRGNALETISERN
jgi:hypothetical protein